MDGFFNKIGSAVTGAASKVQQTTKDLTDQTKMSSEINSLKGQKNTLLMQLGQLVYNYEKNGGAEPNYRELIAQMDAADVRIAELEKQIAALKGLATCPHCGEQIATGSAFCPKCGVNLS